jgi:hypothetical protein
VSTFVVDRILEVTLAEGGLGGMSLAEVPVAAAAVVEGAAGAEAMISASLASRIRQGPA